MSTLAVVAEQVGGRLIGADKEFDSVSTDTRSLQPGQLWFALQGERFDAGDFIAQAAEQGAAGAVVGRELDAAIAQIEVADTRKALGDYAAAWRRSKDIVSVGITGSNGKTTVKEMVSAILRAAYDDDKVVLATKGNFNNDIGLPLTVLRLRDYHRAAVFEMGASGGGEIEYLAAIAAPQVGIVTCAAAAHLEGFGSMAGVASGKGEMFAALPENGVAVINRDDAFYDYWKSVASHTGQVTFGQNAAADFCVSDIEEDVEAGELRFVLRSPLGVRQLLLPMVGRHNVLNAAAAAAAAVSCGFDLDAIEEGLAAMANVSGRLEAVTAPNGMHVYNDTYNANPDSVAAAIDFLAAQPGKRWLVLGDMGELGADAEAMHSSVGLKAREAGIDRLLCVGELSRNTARAWGESAEWFEDTDALSSALAESAEADVQLLVKGSRFMGLERVVNSLLGEAQAGGKG